MGAAGWSSLASGVVTEFDDARGLGTLTDSESGEAVDFHCTAIADGSRHVDRGSTVCYVRGPGHRGRDEARSLVVVASGGASSA